MEILVLSTLLLIGLILLVVEIIFIPGTTVVGIFGFLVSLAGLAFAFINFEYSVAIWITGVTLVINFAAVWYGFIEVNTPVTIKKIENNKISVN